MVKYAMKQLTKYSHVYYTFGTNQPCTFPPLDDSPLLDEAGKKRTQQIVGNFLYYARAVDPTILMTLSENPTERTN